MADEARQAEGLRPPGSPAPAPPTYVSGFPAVPGMVAAQPESDLEPAAAPAPSADRAYVGLAVDPKTRGLVAVEMQPPDAEPSSPKKHDNHAAARAAGVPLWITIENDVAWEWFKELDDDCSGELDQAEAKELCTKLNLKVKNFGKVFAELDSGGDGTVSFSEFVHWFNERKSAERREMRLKIRDIFEKMDKDRSGCLSKVSNNDEFRIKNEAFCIKNEELCIKNDRSGCLSKDEIRTLVKRSKDKLNLVDPPFEIEEDWKAMKKSGGNSKNAKTEQKKSSFRSIFGVFWVKTTSLSGHHSRFGTNSYTQTMIFC